MSYSFLKSNAPFFFPSEEVIDILIFSDLSWFHLQVVVLNFERWEWGMLAKIWNSIFQPFSICGISWKKFTPWRNLNVRCSTIFSIFREPKLKKHKFSMLKVFNVILEFGVGNQYLRLTFSKTQTDPLQRCIPNFQLDYSLE